MARLGGRVLCKSRLGSDSIAGQNPPLRQLDSFRMLQILEPLCLRD